MMALMDPQPEDALDAFLSEGVFDGDQPVIDTDTHAAAAMRRLNRSMREADRIKAAADAERERIATWEADALRPVLNEAQRCDELLVSYYQALLRENPKLPKTYPIPGGTISRRKGVDKVEVIDETAFIEWARDNAPQALSDPKPRPLVSELKGAMWHHVEGTVVSPDGQPVPGVAFVAGVERFAAKPDPT